MILKDKRIYIVEDNPNNIYIVQMILRKHGAVLQADWWASGKPERLLGAMPLNLIILDLVLADGRSGFDIFDEIRSNLPMLANVPIIAVSAVDPSSAIPRAMEQGFAGFISKPVDADRFPQQIAAVMNGEKVWQTGPIDI